MTKFNMLRDGNANPSVNGFGNTFSNTGYAALLATSVAQSVTVPITAQNWLAVFTYSAGSTVFVNGITTASVPGGAFAANTSEINPAGKWVKAGQTLSFITADTNGARVTVNFFEK